MVPCLPWAQIQERSLCSTLPPTPSSLQYQVRLLARLYLACIAQSSCSAHGSYPSGSFVVDAARDGLRRSSNKHLRPPFARRALSRIATVSITVSTTFHFKTRSDFLPVLSYVLDHFVVAPLERSFVGERVERFANQGLGLAESDDGHRNDARSRTRRLARLLGT